MKPVRKIFIPCAIHSIWIGIRRSIALSGSDACLWTESKLKRLLLQQKFREPPQSFSHKLPLMC